MYQEKFPQIVRSSKNRHSENVLLSSLTPASLKSKYKYGRNKTNKAWSVIVKWSILRMEG